MKFELINLEFSFEKKIRSLIGKINDTEYTLFENFNDATKDPEYHVKSEKPNVLIYDTRKVLTLPKNIINIKVIEPKRNRCVNQKKESYNQTQS